MRIIQFFAGILQRLPRSWLWAFASVLAFLWWDVLRLRWFTLYRNITIVFPKLSHEDRRRLVKESLRHLGYTFLETLCVPAVDRDWVERNVVIEGIENYEKARAQNKGVLLLSLHLGNGDMGATVLSLKGFPIHLITKRFSNPWVNDLWWAIRGKKGTQFIDAHRSENAFEILKALRAKSNVVFVLDQFMGRPYGIPSQFFGVNTGTAYGLALFAMKTKAPVVPAYYYRGADFKIHMVFEPEVPWEPRDRQVDAQVEQKVEAREEARSLSKDEDKDLQIAQMTQKYSHVLEALILKHPEQWMWVHRRWKRWE